MEQHPIPQQISSYQFRLVGDMTLKQFFELAGGILVGLIFYSSPLLGIIKWPLAIISVILGVAMAFLPLEERPLERWIIAFFRAIYSPTSYYWKRGSVKEKFFQDESAVSAGENAQQEEAVEKYLSGAKVIPTPYQKLEDAERGFLSTLSGLFSGAVSQVSGAVAQATQPKAAVQASTTPAQEKPKQIEIPQTPAVRVAPETKPKLVVQEKTGPEVQATNVAPVIMGNEFISTRQAQFSVDAAPPNPPTTPNVVVGQVVDAQRRIIDSAIMEIRDSAGRPVRALRSNKLGHFITVTPLESGKYEIITEKEGFEFTPVSFEANGQIIPPILVQGRPSTVAPVSSTQVAQGANISVSQII